MSILRRRELARESGDRFEICPRHDSRASWLLQEAKARAFTLIELLAVIAILGLIAAFAVPQVLKWVSGARSDSARIQIDALGGSIDLYRLEVGSFPPTLKALVEKPPGNDRWNGPYLKKKVIPKDPWGNDYIYRYPGNNGSYDLMSLGADNTEGGEGEQKDIVSWE